MFLGVIWLYSSLFPLAFSLPGLPLARSSIPSRPCYRQLGLQFAVGENSSPGHGPFLHSLHFPQRLLSQTGTWFPIVSTVIGSTPSLSPQGLVPLPGCSYNPLTQLASYCPFSLHRPRDFSTVAPRGYAQLPNCTASLPDGQHLEFLSNSCNAARVYSGPCTSTVLLLLSLTLGFKSGYNSYIYCWYLRQQFSC